MEDWMDPDNRERILGLLIILCLIVLASIGGIWMVVRLSPVEVAELPEDTGVAEYHGVPEFIESTEKPKPTEIPGNNLEQIKTVSTDEIIRVLESRGYDVHVLQWGDVGSDAPNIEDRITFDADGHRFWVTVYKSMDLAWEYSSEEDLEESQIFENQFSTFRLRRTAVKIKPADDNYAMLIERLIVLYQESY